MTKTKSNIEYISKHLAVLEEVETSSKLIRLGFGEIQNLNQSNDFYFLPFQLLSQGFERLMKSYICLGHLDKTGEYPIYSYIKSLGHDLEKLLKEILSEYFVYKEHATLLNDKEFLENDTELKELLYILSEFGKLARYHNFDIITGNQQPSVNPKDLWTAFRNKIIFSNSTTMDKLGDWELHNEIYGDLSRYILVLFEKFVSALSRQFLFGGLGEKGKQFSNPFSDFGTLFSNDFGNTDYRNNTTKYQMNPRKIHKRNLMDIFDRKFNTNYVSKVIMKAEFDGEWPFYTDKVIIECRYKHWCVVTIDGHDYSLNGSAKGKYKLEDAHEAGMAILGIGTGDFINMALELGRQKPSR
jgi:hypothetical protein